MHNICPLLAGLPSGRRGRKNKPGSKTFIYKVSSGMDSERGGVGVFDPFETVSHPSPRSLFEMGGMDTRSVS